MNKRIICLLLSLIMMLGVLAGCGQKDKDTAIDDIANKASSSTMTLSMYLMIEEPISETQEKLIEDAVNKITKAQFKTKLDLRFFTPDEYYERLEADLATEKANVGTGKNNKVTSTTEATAEETVVNEQGVVELKYPTIEDYRVDMFYIGGYDKFKEYKDANHLTKLDDNVNNASKLLYSYMAPEFLAQMKSMNSGIFAIPTNKPIGEYTYLLLKKDVLAEMNYIKEGLTPDLSEFTSLTSAACEDVLQYVSDYMDEYVPLYSGTGELDGINVRFWGLDESGNLSDDFSILGGSYSPDWVYPKKDNFSVAGNIFANSTFTEQLLKLKQYEESGFYAEEGEEDKSFAVGYVKGGAEVIEEYSDEYEIVVVEKPVLTTEDIYSDMFAISSLNYDRCMEIITYLNTNTTFRNIFAYGIEGINYELLTETLVNESGEKVEYKKVRKLNNDYAMDVNKTGNVLITYPLENEITTIREFQQKQNLDSKVSLIMSFNVHHELNYTINTSLMKKVRDNSAEIYKRIEACATSQELSVLLKELALEVNNSDYYSLVSNNSYAKILANKGVGSYDEAANGVGDSFAAVYYAWLERVGLYVPTK